jgi:XTP/dITP diphosphohydrolase
MAKFYPATETKAILLNSAPERSQPWQMLTLIVATHSEHKITEITQILGSDFNCISLKDFPGAPVPVEDAPDYRGNALKKAHTIAKWLEQNPQYLSTLPRSTSRLFVIADDSGLEVDFLEGAPGVYSARFASDETGVPGNASAGANNAKLLRMLDQVPEAKRSARFRCTVALVPVVLKESQNASPVCDASEAEQLAEVFEAACEGAIVRVERGRVGFGYDPLFVPAGYDRTFAELPDTLKNEISHRGLALKQLKKALLH